MCASEKNDGTRAFFFTTPPRSDMEQLERRLKGHSLPQAVNDCANRRASSCHSYHSSVAAAAENGRASSLHNNEATFSERRVQTMKGCCCISNQVGSTFTSIYTMVSDVGVKHYYLASVLSSGGTTVVYIARPFFWGALANLAIILSCILPGTLTKMTHY